MTRGDKLRFSTKLGYGIGNLSFGLVMQMITGYFMFYAMHILGLPGKWVGFIASIAAVWDAVTDPVMGYISDHTTSQKYGRRHGYLLWGCIITAVSSYFLWQIDPAIPRFWRFASLLFFLLASRTGTTIYGVPYNALAAELTLDYHERTNVQGYKTFFFVLGLILPSVLTMLIIFAPTDAYPLGQLNPAAYQTMGYVCAASVLLLGFPSFFVTRDYQTYATKEKKRGSLKNVFAALLATFENKPFRQVTLGYLLINLASAWVGGLALNTFTFALLYSNRKISLVMGVLFGCAILAQPIWLGIEKRRNKRTALARAVFVGLCGSFGLMVCMLFLREYFVRNFLLILPFMVVIGSGIGGMLSIPPSMVADVALLHQRKTAQRMEGTFFGSFTLAYKLAQSLCILLLGVVLDWVHFQDNAVLQTSETQFWLGLLLPLGCMIFFALAFSVYRRYSLTREEVDEAREWILAHGESPESHIGKK